MTTPTVYKIRIALETALFAALTPAFESGEIGIVQPGEEIAPDLKKIQVIHSFGYRRRINGLHGVCGQTRK